MAEAYEKTEAPTPRRRAEARREGQVARSADLAAAAVILVALVLMQTTGPKLLAAFRSLLTTSLSEPANQVTTSDVMHFTKTIGFALLPLLAGVVLVAIVVNLLQVGFISRLRFRQHALDIGKGMQRIFSARSRVRLVMDLLKLAAVAWLAWSLLDQCFDRIAGLQQFDVPAAFSAGALIVNGVALRIAVLLLTLGVLDYAYQRWQYERDLRMTRREIKDELRQMEGDPKVRQIRREVIETRKKKSYAPVFSGGAR